VDERTRVLLIEDDRNIVDLVRSNLAARGFSVAGLPVAIIGTDGLPDPAGGDQAVLDGKFAATFVYPTGAAEALAIAKKILVDCATSVELNTVVPTTLVDKDAAGKLIAAASS
jgi:hypothetical protein